MFTGLSAFPLTPITASGVDEKGFSRILSRLTEARVDSMGILGSTGSYAFLTREQRQHVTTLAKQHSGDIPVMVCVSSQHECHPASVRRCASRWSRCLTAPGGQLPVAS